MEQARYEIRLYDPTTGGLSAIFDSWISLHYEKEVNAVSTLSLSIPLDDPRVALFNLDAIVEVWRTPFGSAPYNDFTGFHRSPQMAIQSNKKVFSSTTRSLTDLIARRAILYPKTTAYSLKSGPGETVIKSYVDENAGPGANAVSRLVSGVTYGLALEADAAQGLDWFGDQSYINLLDVIKEIASVTNVDFDVIRVGALDFEFRCYYPQRGTDRRASVIFGPNLGNMIDPVYSMSRTDEITYAAALGSGSGLTRHVVGAAATAESDSLWNHVEAIESAVSEDTYNALLAAANTKLEDSRAQETFTFNIIPSAKVYGRDYFLGDIVTATFETVIRVMKITGVTVDVAEGKESVSCTFRQLPLTA
jgi:hypothetical protein